MIDDLQLESLLTDLESDRVERKQSLSDRSAIRQAICAFANDMPGHNQPGVIFIGVKDDGSCGNLPITDELLRQRATASAEEERRLAERRRAHDIPFDLHPRASATLDDLDLDLFQRTYLPAAFSVHVVDQNQRSVQQQLASLRFATIDGNCVPTVVGLLTVGKSPADFLPGAYVQFLRIDGEELTDAISDQKVCHGPLPELLRQIDGILSAHIQVATDVTSGATETRTPDYPIAALQQLVRNAIMHRDYQTSHAPTRITWFSNRVEIQNPGGPFGQVTIENFGQPGITDYRNPHVAEAMRTLGYVQRFGIGIQIARKQLADNASPEPEFDVQPNHLLVIVRRRP